MYYPVTGTHRRIRSGMRGLGATTPSLTQIQQMITASAQQYGVDPSLALAIAQQESSFNPSAVSQPNKNGTVDYGLMQINSKNLSSLGLTPATALDPQSNINAAMQLLSSYTQQYNGDPSLIAAAYNGGPVPSPAGTSRHPTSPRFCPSCPTLEPSGRTYRMPGRRSHSRPIHRGWIHQAIRLRAWIRPPCCSWA